MKKLFATLLAATMVAGTAVSALAYVKGDQAAKASSKDDDYTLSKIVYDEDGKDISKQNKIGSGDKIYYPILVDGDALDKDGLKAGAYYYATAASEIDNLKVTLKAVRGGKYIKGASIVRKDLGKNVLAGLTSYDDAEKAWKAAQVKVTDAQKELDEAKKAQANLEKTATAEEKAAAQKAVTDAEATKAAADKAVKDANEEKANKLKAAIQAVNAIEPKKLDENTADIAAVNAAITELEKSKDVTAAKAAATEAAKATGATAEQTKAVTDAQKELDEAKKAQANLEKTATAEEKAAAKAKVEKAQTELDKAKAELKAAETAYNDAKNISKIYCVEVELKDYFGTEATEVDFDLSLRTKSKQYETKDAKEAPTTSFDLGEDAAEGTDIINNVPLKFGTGKLETKVKFRSNELTLYINKDTGAINCEEAKKDDKPETKAEDVERIFLEGDDFNYEVKASSQGELYLAYNQDANKKVVVANPDAKMDFFNFPGKPEFDFTGLAQFDVEDPDVNYYFYEIVDDKPVKTSAKYNKEDECFDLRTRTLGSYVISDKELKAAENPADKDADKPATDKPTTETPVNPTTPGKNVPTGAIA